MGRQVQMRGGTTLEHSTFTGAVREITVDTDKKTAVVHDGATVGGIPLAKEADLNVLSGKIDSILFASSADKDSFKEIVDFINSVDLNNDNALASYVSTTNGRLDALENNTLITNWNAGKIDFGTM